MNDKIAKFFNHEYLRYGAIDAKPMFYDWYSNTMDSDLDGNGWEIAEFPDLETTLLNLEEVYLPNVNEAILTIDVPDDDGDIKIDWSSDSIDAVNSLLKRFKIEISLDEFENTAITICPGDDAWELLIDLWELSEIDFDCPDREDWMPMYNFAYPLPNGYLGSGDWRLAMNNCTIVTINSDHYLALTGCGMDFSWEICETYLRCGYWPPTHFDLPRMAGRGKSDLDKMIIAACIESLTAVKERMENNIKYLRERFDDI